MGKNFNNKYKINDFGFVLDENSFPSQSHFKKAESLIKSINPFSNDSEDKLVLTFDLLYLYYSENDQSSEIDSLLFNLKIPKYDKLRFEILSEGKLNSKSFRIKIKTYNSKDELIELSKEAGDFYKDTNGKSYFLAPPQSNFISSWNSFYSNLSDPKFQNNLQFRIEEYEKLSIAYEKLEIDGNSILDTLKIKIIDDFQYNLVGNEDGTLDIIPSFELDLQKYNTNLNILAETSKTSGPRVSLRDRTNKKNVELIFTEKGAEIWEQFYKIKHLPITERTAKLKESDFLDIYPPSDIIGDVFSDRVLGFTLESPQKAIRDNKSSESWSDGFDDISNLLRSKSGSNYSVSLSPSPDIYAEIKSSIEDLKNKITQEEELLKNETGAILTSPALAEETIFLSSMHDEFTLSELQTFAERIEKTNKATLDVAEVDYAKSLIDEAIKTNSHTVNWKNLDGDEVVIPRKSLELGLSDFLKSEKSHHSISVQVNEPIETISTNEQTFSIDWFLKNSKADLTPTSISFKPSIKLRPHQIHGYAWLKGIAENTDVLEKCKFRGALLADDMGLGKTIQVIRLITDFKNDTSFSNKPILIVAPLSLLETSWKVDGFQAFLSEDFLKTNRIVNIKDLKNTIPKNIAIKEVLRIDQELSSNKNLNFTDIKLSGEIQKYLDNFKTEVNSSIVLCSYETLRSRIFELGAVDFSLVILDEAQKIKNQSTGQSSAAKALKADMKVAMTGTPIENTITDLWNICDFVVPGYLGSIKKFRDDYLMPISQLPPGSEERRLLADNLENNLRPIWLRRTKKEILKSGELPPIFHYDSSFDENGNLYNKHSVEMNEQQFKIFEAQVGYFNESKAGHKLAAIRNMMEACYAPWWATGLKADYANFQQLCDLCPKLKITFQILDQIAFSDEKVIIFANIKDLQQDLAWLIHQWYFFKFQKSVDCEVFNGDSTLEMRSSILKRFKEAKGFKAIIISPRSGGAGLNLVQANHVIHYTREWNPAVERQATDRAHRLGQTKAVHVYYPTSSLSHLGKTSAEEHLALILRDEREVIDDFTVSQGDFGGSEDSFNTFRFSSPNEPRINPEGIRTLGPYRFEQLVALYLEKSGYQVELVGQAGDHGCDIVCHGKDKNLLVQVKFSENNHPQGTKPINEIRGSKSFYEKKHNKKFNLMAATNTIFTPNAWNLSINGDNVELLSGDTFNQFLLDNIIHLSSLKK